MANPGYGKRSVPDDGACRTSDASGYARLPAREACIAAFIDRLPDGAAMDAKTLAKHLPLHGQQAVRSALNALSQAGHLRRVRRLAETVDGTVRWVFRTFWSPVARDDEWWVRFLADDDGGVKPDTVDTVVHPRPASEPTPAYTLLARLAHTDPRLPLSAADCAALEPLAAEWLSRGATADHFVRVMTSGLPERVHAPRAFLQRRLQDKMPPELPSLSRCSSPRTILECTSCGVPGRPEALPGGLCRGCREAPQGAITPAAEPQAAPGNLPESAVHHHVTQLRAVLAARSSS